MKKKKINIILKGALVFFLSVFASGFLNQTAFAMPRLKGKLVLTGSSTVAPLAAEIGKRFESIYPDVKVDVQTGGSSRGIADATQGVADIGMVSRALKKKEKKLFAFTIAKDGICVILHESNPLKVLTDDQIVKIYTGKIKNWKAVGGKKAPITVVNKAEGRSTLELFLKYFGLKSSQIRPHIIIGDNEQGIKTVSGNPDAIGYVSIGAAEYSAEHHIPIRLLPIGGVSASIKNVREGKFPLSRPLNLVTRKKPVGLAKAFIKFSRSEKVHDVVKQQYFVPFVD